MCDTGSSIISGNDKQVMQLLDRLLNNPGYPLPSNVIDYVNPFEFDPSNLPDVDTSWYLVKFSERSKQTNGGGGGGGGGIWKEKGDACRISVASSSIIGWRRTHEYFDQRAADDAHKTGSWMMQEYSISCEHPNKQKGSTTTSLCRVYQLCDQENGNKDHLTTKESKLGQEPREDVCFLTRNYLELADLDNTHPSSSSTSHSSSAISSVSRRFFDPDALLAEIARDDEACSQLRPVCHKLNVSRPTADVVLSAGSTAQERIVTSRSISIEESLEPAASTSAPHKDYNKRKVEVSASSTSGDSIVSSTRQRPRGKKVHVRIGKSIKKLFCFLAI